MQKWSSYKTAFRRAGIDLPGLNPWRDNQVWARVVAFTRTLRYVFSSHVSLINIVTVDAPTSTVLRREGPQAFSSPGALESSSKSCRSDWPTLGLGWHEAEHGYPDRAGPAGFHLGTEPSTIRVTFQHALTGAFHCTDNGPVEDSVRFVV